MNTMIGLYIPSSGKFKDKRIRSISIRALSFFLDSQTKQLLWHVGPKCRLLFLSQTDFLEGKRLRHQKGAPRCGETRIPRQCKLRSRGEEREH